MGCQVYFHEVKDECFHSTMRFIFYSFVVYIPLYPVLKTVTWASSHVQYQLKKNNPKIFAKCKGNMETGQRLVKARSHDRICRILTNVFVRFAEI